MKKVLILLALSTILFSCETDDNYSDKAEIKNFDVINVSNINLNYVKTDILSNQKIYVYFNNDLNNISFPITLDINIEISPGASLKSISNDQISINDPDNVETIKVEAEDGSVTNWYLFLVHKQVLNSDFEDWYLKTGINGIDYDEIGLSDNKTVWSTANLGTSLYGKYCAQPLIDGDIVYARIITDSISPNVPLATGTLFTGKFSYQAAITNPLNPKLATIFGTPFISKPTSFRVKYSYISAERYVQVNYNSPTYIFAGNEVEEIEGEDNCAIYAILENRNGDTVTEIAKAELFSASTEGVVEDYISFEYTSELEPTHISVVFSSSKDGDLWKGADGSELIIQEFELIYE